ncbi:MAG: hypothetical protein EHM24_21080 [Acidobacteria bacterium]|nr:MAG: hypothetical protein EHM24_21080 [Acidobacteriota bacterium]
MTLRIAFDLDGTLADMEPAVEEISARLFPQPPEQAQASAPATQDQNGASEELTPEEEQLEPPSVRMLTQRQQHAIWDEVRRTENFWESLGETEPGIVSRIAEIAEERRWEVIFITTRPESGGDTTQRQSQRWLAAHGFALPSVFVASGSRGKIAAALSLDIVVDDRTENCLDVKLDSPARSILVARDAIPQTAANAKRLGIDAVPSVGALLDELTATPPAKPSLLGRLKTMIGAGRR